MFATIIFDETYLFTQWIHFFFKFSLLHRRLFIQIKKNCMHPSKEQDNVVIKSKFKSHTSKKVTATQPYVIEKPIDPILTKHHSLPSKSLENVCQSRMNSTSWWDIWPEIIIHKVFPKRYRVSKKVFVSSLISD